MAFLLGSTGWAAGPSAVHEKGFLGNYVVGYCDTVIYDATKPYAQFGYQGPAPLFVQIWHPLNDVPETSALTYGDLQQRQVPENLKAVWHQLVLHNDTAFVNYNLLETLGTLEPVTYGAHTPFEVLQSIKTIRTASFFSRLSKKRNYPVIVYHHGAQGLSDENCRMAEYFASRGYIFVSANFHLPFANLPLGSLPYEAWEVFLNDQHLAKTVIQFAQGLSKSDALFYVGHSWGAQEGWRFLHEPGWADAFVSLETTLEYHSGDTAFIRELWPQVYQTLVTEQRRLDLPVMLFANTLEDAPFGFFENKAARMYHVSERDTFEHGAYTSAYLLRYDLRETYAQSDTLLLKKRLVLYEKHLELMHAFFQAVMRGKELETGSFRPYFYLH